MMRWPALAVVLATLLVTVGCGMPTITVARGAAGSSVRAGEIDREALAARTLRVLLPPAAVAPLAVTVDPEDELDFTDLSGSQTSEYCSKWVSDQGSPRSHVVHSRTWIQPGRIVVVSKAHGYGWITAAHAVDTTRNNAGLCQQYLNFAGDETFDLLDVVDPGALTGLDDRYGRCLKVTGKDPDGRPLYGCAMFLARGDLLSHVEVWTFASVDAAKTALLALAPAAAAALATG